MKPSTYTNKLIEAAHAGDKAAFEELHIAVNMLRGMRHLQEKYQDGKRREVFIIIGKSFFGMNFREMGELFRVHKTLIGRIWKRRKKY